MLDRRRVPAYARAIIQDLKATSYVQLVAVLDSPSADHDLALYQAESPLLRAYTRLIDARYQAEPDPLAITDVTGLLSDIPAYLPDGSASLDVVLNFRDAAADRNSWVTPDGESGVTNSGIAGVTGRIGVSAGAGRSQSSQRH